MVIFFVGLREYFTGFSAQTEEAQDYRYNGDDVENVHSHGSLVKNYDKYA
jgi:hypothetical protein